MYKSMLTATIEAGLDVAPKTFKVQHKHCPDCGACLLPSSVHRCERPIDPEIQAVMDLDMRPADSRRALYATTGDLDGYHVVDRVDG